MYCILSSGTNKEHLRGDGARKVASGLAENHGVDSFQVRHGPRLIDCGCIRPAIGTVWLGGHWSPSSG